MSSRSLQHRIGQVFFHSTSDTATAASNSLPINVHENSAALSTESDMSTVASNSLPINVHENSAASSTETSEPTLARDESVLRKLRNLLPTKVHENSAALSTETSEATLARDESVLGNSLPTKVHENSAAMSTRSSEPTLVRDESVLRHLTEDVFEDHKWGSHHSGRFHAMETVVITLLFFASLIWPALAYQILDEFTTTHDKAMCLFLTEVSVIIPRLFCVYTALFYVVPAVTGESPKLSQFLCKTPTRAGVLVTMLTATHQLRAGLLHLFTVDKGGERAMFMPLRELRHLEGFIALLTFYSVIDTLHNHLADLCHTAMKPILESKPMTKWRTITRRFTSFENPEKDELWSMDCIHPSAHSVLLEVASAYMMLFKAVALCLYFVFTLDINLYENAVWVTTVTVTLGVMRAAQLEQGISVLIPLAISNPFLVGEIISFSQPGQQPADNPKTSTAGFVEGITWTHLVIRDFKKKQIFLPLQVVQTLLIHNWTRRPTKLCYWLLQASSGDKDGTKITMLARFVRKWIAANDMIDREGYTKATVKTDLTSGLQMEVVFYPKMGENVHQLRAEFVVTIMDAANRMNLTLIPQNMATPFPEQFPFRSGSTATNTAGETSAAYAKSFPEGSTTADIDGGSLHDSQLDDLLPHEGLRKRAGFE